MSRFYWIVIITVALLFVALVVWEQTCVIMEYNVNECAPTDLFLEQLEHITPWFEAIGSCISWISYYVLPLLYNIIKELFTTWIKKIVKFLKLTVLLDSISKVLIVIPVAIIWVIYETYLGYYESVKEWTKNKKEVDWYLTMYIVSTILILCVIVGVIIHRCKKIRK